METVEDIKRLYEITKTVEKQLESHFKNSEYRPVIRMVRKGKEGVHDHGVLACALGMYGISNHDHGTGEFLIQCDPSKDPGGRTDQ